MEIFETLTHIRKAYGLTQEEFGAIAGVSSQTVSAWETGRREPQPSALKKISKHFSIKLSDIIDGTILFDAAENLLKTLKEKDQMLLENGPRDTEGLLSKSHSFLDRHIVNVFPVTSRKIPVLGNVAAGTPIWAEEEHEEYIDDAENISADFALRVRGESMSPLINDGDIVYVKAQNEVRNGQIAVVLDGDSATLKHVYKNRDSVSLVSVNPHFSPIIYFGEQAHNLKVLGIAIAYKRRL